MKKLFITVFIVICFLSSQSYAEQIIRLCNGECYYWIEGPYAWYGYQVPCLSKQDTIACLDVEPYLYMQDNGLWFWRKSDLPQEFKKDSLEIPVEIDPDLLNDQRNQ